MKTSDIKFVRSCRSLLRFYSAFSPQPKRRQMRFIVSVYRQMEP